MVKTVVVVAFIASSAWGQPAAQKLLSTKEWKGSLTRKTSLVAGSGGCKAELDSTELYTNLRLTLDDDFDDGKCWVAKTKASLIYHSKNEISSTGTYILEEDTAKGEANVEVRLCIYTADNKWRLTPTFTTGVRGTHHKVTRSTGVPATDTTEPKDITPAGMIDKAEGPLPASRNITGQVAETPQLPTGCGMATAKVSEDWSLTGDPTKPKAFIDPPAKHWLPAVGGAGTTVKIRWTDAASDVEATLETSTEPGAYMNDTDAGKDSDLRVEPAAPWSVTPAGTRATKYTATRHVDASLREIELPITAYDYGAYGKVRARVKMAGTWVSATTDTNQPSVNVPFDLDDDHVADQWEEEQHVADKDARWDEDWLPDTATAKGDTSTLYEEYRGFYTLDASRRGAWRRMNPRQREYFVEDSDQLVDAKLFEDATGVAIVFVDPPHQQNRVVNYRRGYGHVADKYAVKILKVDTAVRDGVGYLDDTSATHTTAGSTYPSAPRSPKAVKWIAVFTGNITGLVNGSFKTMIDRAMKKANGEAGTMLANAGFSRQDIERAAAKMADPGFIQKIIRQQINLTVIHELGHGMGVPHHSGDQKGGVKSCPMRYDTDLEIASALIRALGHEDEKLPTGVSRLCTTDDNSAAKINLKD